jgi:hypothetical protein
MKCGTVLLPALLLVFAAHADAKFSSARVCGPSDCREVTLASGQSLAIIQEAALLPRSQPISKPPEAAPWYRVTLCPGRCDSPSAPALRVLPAGGYQYLAPEKHLARKGWTKLDEPAANVYRRVTKGLEPFPASGLIPLGAVASDPAHGDGFPRWGWVLIAGAIAALTLLALRWLRRPGSEAHRPSPSPGMRP